MVSVLEWFNCYHREVSVVALYKPGGIVRGIVYGMDKYHSTYQFSGVITQRLFEMNCL